MGMQGFSPETVKKLEEDPKFYKEVFWEEQNYTMECMKNNVESTPEGFLARLKEKGLI